MKTNKGTSGKRKVLIVLAVLVIIGSACGGDGDENDTVAPVPAVNTTDDVANEIVQDTSDAVEEVNTTLRIISEVNCKLGFDSCNEIVKDLDSVVTPE